MQTGEGGRGWRGWNSSLYTWLCLEITPASKDKSGIPIRLWMKSQIIKYFLVLLSPCQLILLSLSVQKHSSVRGWWGRFESIKGWIPACIWVHPSYTKTFTARSNRSPSQGAWKRDKAERTCVYVQLKQEATVDTRSSFMWKLKIWWNVKMWNVVTRDGIWILSRSLV